MFTIYEEVCDVVMTIPQNELKVWIMSYYLSYEKYCAWVHDEEKSWENYKKVIVKFYKSLANALNNFSIENEVYWDGLSEIDAEYDRPLIFTIENFAKPKIRGGYDREECE